MPDSLTPNSPTVRTLDATMTCTDGRSVVLDETYFYLEGGGQSANRGVLGSVGVEHVHANVDGVVVHDLAADPGFAAGDEAMGTVDDDLRTYHMRTHIASHILYGAGRRIFNDLGYGGLDISMERVRVDFEASTEVDDDALVKLECLVGRAIWDSREVSWGEISIVEARDREEIALDVRTEEGVFSESETVRVVSIDSWDRAACGGTHVPNTAGIGLVEVLSRSNPGEGLTRVEFAVGSPAVDRRAVACGSAYEAVRVLRTNLDGLGESATAATIVHEELESELTDFKSKVLRSRLVDFETAGCDRLTWNIGAISGFDANKVGEAAKEARGGTTVDMFVAVSESGVPFVAVANAGDVAAGKIVVEVTDEFDGGSDDGPTFAQGDDLGAPANEVLVYLCDRMESRTATKTVAC